MKNSDKIKTKKCLRKKRAKELKFMTQYIHSYQLKMPVTYHLCED